MLAQIGLAQTPVLPSSMDASMRDLQTFVSERAYMSSFQLAKELKRTSMYQNNSSVKEKVDFYLLVSGLQLDEKGIVEEATDFIKAAVDPAFRQMMTYYVGIYYFRNNNPAQSLAYLETAKLANLTNAQIGEVKYLLGYVYFSVGQFEKAKQLSAEEHEAAGRFTGAIASIMLLPTFIVGLYGQNFIEMPETDWHALCQ